MESEKAVKFLGEQDAASARLHEVGAAFRRVITALDELKDGADDMLCKVEKLYGKDQARLVGLCASDASRLREKIDTLFDEVKMKDQEIQTMTGLVRTLDSFEFS